MEGETDRDPVVSRFNVYLSKRLSKNLILLQYPVRSGLASYDDGDIISTRAKPQQHAVEIELAADFKHQSSNLGLSGMDKIVSINRTKIYLQASLFKDTVWCRIVEHS